VFEFERSRAMRPLPNCRKLTRRDAPAVYPPQLCRRDALAVYPPQPFTRRAVAPQMAVDMSAGQLVELDGGLGRVRVRAANLAAPMFVEPEAAASEYLAAPAAAATLRAPDARIVLHSLVSRREYNGAAGAIDGPPTADGLQPVRLDTGERFSVAPSNLAFIAQSAPAVAPAQAPPAPVQAPPAPVAAPAPAAPVAAPVAVTPAAWPPLAATPTAWPPLAATPAARPPVAARPSPPPPSPLPASPAPAPRVRPAAAPPPAGVVVGPPKPSPTAAGVGGAGSLPAPPPPAPALAPPPALAAVPRALSAVYVDLAGFIDAFCPSPWSLASMRACAGAFMRGAWKAGVAVKFFLPSGAGPVSADALPAWRRAECAAAAAGAVLAPPGALTLLGDVLCAELGVPVLYARDADVDETLAAHAHADGADVLAADLLAYARFAGARFRIFTSFTLANERFFAVEAAPAALAAARRLAASAGRARALPPAPPPPGAPPPPAGSQRPLVALAAPRAGAGAPPPRPVFRAGAASPLARALGASPQHTARPLRQALYARVLGPGAEVTEELAFFSPPDARPAWSCDTVPALTAANAGGGDAECQRLKALLDGPPDDAFRAFFPAEAAAWAVGGGEAGKHWLRPEAASPEDWPRHVWACRAVVFSLCAQATDRTLASLW
jgi:hypothetical protein